MALVCAVGASTWAGNVAAQSNGPPPPPAEELPDPGSGAPAESVPSRVDPSTMSPAFEGSAVPFNPIAPATGGVTAPWLGSAEERPAPIPADDHYLTQQPCGPTCDGWEGCAPMWHLVPFTPTGVRVGGWLNGGYVGNLQSPASNFNGPFNWQDRNGAALNQAWVFVDRPAASYCGSGFDIGGHVDVFWGQDYRFAQARGLELRPNGADRWNTNRLYGVALPQFYGDLAMGRLSIRVGHFFTPIGYEVVQAPGNFFYTHSYAFQFAQPYTHTGGLVRWNHDDCLTIFGGLTNGWDNFDTVRDRPAALAGLRYNLDEILVFSTSLITGQEPTNFGRMTNRTLFNMVFDVRYSPQIEYAIESYLAVQPNNVDLGTRHAQWYGVNQYLFYHVNCRWKIGFRGEWFRDEDGTRVGGARPGNPNRGPFMGNFCEVTGGVNWNPVPNFRLRPEVRVDWFDGNGRPFNDGARKEQITLALDALLLY